MSIKFTAIAAATVAVLGSAAAADASYFSYQDSLSDSTTLRLGTVTSAGNGVVEIYDFRTGELGALLGTEDIFAGANSDVRVKVGYTPTADVIAVLKVDGQTVATRDYNIN